METMSDIKTIDTENGKQFFSTLLEDSERAVKLAGLGEQLEATLHEDGVYPKVRISSSGSIPDSWFEENSIVRELRNENIDVINYTANTQLLIQRALSPAKITSVKLKEDTGRAEVFLKPDQVSLAIGKG